jgi:hypothetical protein
MHQLQLPAAVPAAVIIAARRDLVSAIWLIRTKLGPGVITWVSQINENKASEPMSERGMAPYRKAKGLRQTRLLYPVHKRY